MDEQMTLPYVGPETDTFPANGKKYIVHKSLNITRYREYERLQVIAGFGAEYTTLFNGLKKAYTQLNEMKAADASVTLYNLMEGVSRKVNKHQSPLLLMCTLFINAEGEDLTQWNEPAANEKIADWEAEGYDVQGFFLLYLHWARNFEAGSLSASLPTSEDSPAQEENLQPYPNSYSPTYSEPPTFTGSN